MPLHRRGLQFDGTKYLNVTGLTFSSTFSITAWIRVDGNSNIFSISRTDPAIDTAEEENVLNFGDVGDRIYFSYYENGVQ
jgi:hypothetical protein